MLTREDLDQIKEIVSASTKAIRLELGDDIAHVVSVMATKDDIADVRRELQETRKELREEFSAEMDRKLGIVIMNMATKKELQEVRNELADLRENLNTAVNAFSTTATALSDLRLEYAAVSVQQSRQVGWNHKVGVKVGIPYEY